MATHLKENSSIEVVADMVDATAAALESDPETAELAETWRAMTVKADAMAAERRALDRAVRRARARLNVSDGMWDTTVAAFGRAVVDASGGHRDQPPYSRFFAKTAPHKTQTFGTAREIDLGRAWLVELARNPDEPLSKTWTPKLKDATDTLASAFEERDAGVKAIGPQQTAVVLFIDDVNRELDRLDGELRKLFAGSTERVASFLAATRPSRRYHKDDTDQTPDIPAE